MYKRHASGWLKHLDFIILDVICLQISFFLAILTRNGDIIPYHQSLYREVVLVFCLLDLVVVFFSSSYQGILRRGYWREFKATIYHVTYVVLALTVYLYLLKKAEEFSRFTYGMTWIYWVILSFLFRNLWKWVLSRKNQWNPAQKSVLIVSDKGHMEKIVSHFQSYNYEGICLSGLVIVEAEKPLDEYRKVKGIPIVANEDTLLEYITNHWVDEIFVDIAKEIALPMDLINQCIEAGVTVHLNMSKVTGIHAQKQEIDRIAGYTVLSNSLNMATPRQALMKRAIDVLGGIVGCIITVIFTIIFGPIIFVKSPGPIFFHQMRVGKNGRKFKIYKFRSMYMDAEERKKELMRQNKIQDGMMFKMDNDPRIIKGIGHFIRKYSIDEFPQFWNVLKGDMSLVGTRPPTIDEWEKYQLHHRTRLAMKPGLTGLWQVSGRSNITDFEEVVKLDTEYILNWNFGRDLRIILKTVLVIFKNDGAM